MHLPICHFVKMVTGPLTGLFPTEGLLTHESTQARKQLLLRRPMGMGYHLGTCARASRDRCILNLNEWVHLPNAKSPKGIMHAQQRTAQSLLASVGICVLKKPTHGTERQQSSPSPTLPLTKAFRRPWK